MLLCPVGCLALALQDRGYWDEDNVQLFPNTAKVFQDMDGEVAGAATLGGKATHAPTFNCQCFAAGAMNLCSLALSCCTHSVCPTAVHLLLPTHRWCAAPTLEVFFARQPPGTGVKRHTDYVNFVQTTHLGLIVPEGDCWMKARRGPGAGCRSRTGARSLGLDR